MIGLSFRETMSGGYHLSSAPDVDLPMSFTVRAKVPSLRSMLGEPRFEIDGEVSAAGLANHKALRGTLFVDPLRSKQLVYEFEFEADDGRRCSFQGKKTLSEGNLVQAWTVLPGGIFDASGAEVGKALLRFDLRSDFIKLLGSLRLIRN